MTSSKSVVLRCNPIAHNAYTEVKDIWLATDKGQCNVPEYNLAVEA